jgi:uncharacterized membrane protein
MAATRAINLSYLSEHRRILNLWLGVIFAGLLIFVGLLFLSYFVLNNPVVTNDAMRYKKAEASLGFSELAGLALSVVALFRYMSVKTKYRERIFDKLIADNQWTQDREYELDKVASTLLGAGVSYEEGFGFSGKLGVRTFSCLVFQYIAPDSQVRRYICLSFKLPKAFPMIVIDNRLNDHKFRRHGSDLPDQIPNSVELKLEGDFNKYYQVSTTKGREQETLEVLSPDFMADLMGHATDKVDVEISDKKLFLIYEANFYSEQNLTALFNVADAVLGKLDKLSKTWLVSGKGEEVAIADTAREARHKLIFRSDLLTLIIGLLFFVVFITLMVSSVAEQTEEPQHPAPMYLQLP